MNNNSNRKLNGEKITLEIVEKNRRRVLEFSSEEDRRGWEKAYRKSKLHIPYFLFGIGVNFLLYFAGLDLSRDIFWGALIGLAIPMASMFILSELHYRLLIERRGKALVK
ncbi:MAG: hypothetical protein ACOY30_02430 [Bacillota bacterium]